MGIESLERFGGVAAFGRGVGNLYRAGLTDGQCEINQHVARVVRDIQRRGMIGLSRQNEGRAVFEYPGGGCQREAAGRQQIAIQRIFDQAPGMRPQGLHPTAHKLFRPAVLLLEMLRAQEHTFLPYHAVGPTHRSWSFLRPVLSPETVPVASGNDG